MTKRQSGPDSCSPTQVTRKVITTLKSVPAFNGLSQEDARELLNTCETVFYKKGRTIFSEGMPGNEVYLIMDGTIKITATAPQGRTKVLGMLTNGDFLGEMAAIVTEKRTATAYVHEDTTMIMIRRKDFLDFLKENNEVTMKVLRGLCEHVMEANEEIKNFTFHDQPGRLAQTLLALHAKFPGKKGTPDLIDLKLTHQDLADMLGIARESITKIISTMKKDGAIDIQDHYVTITDKDKLESWIQ
jgi:CRP/FNR family transcriptional regulator